MALILLARQKGASQGGPCSDCVQYGLGGTVLRHFTTEEAIRARLRELTKKTRRLHEELREMLRKDEEGVAAQPRSAPPARGRERR